MDVRNRRIDEFLERVMDGGRNDHLHMQERRPQAVSKTVVCQRVSHADEFLRLNRTGCRNPPGESRCSTFPTVQ